MIRILIMMARREKLIIQNVKPNTPISPSFRLVASLIHPWNNEIC